GSAASLPRLWVRMAWLSAGVGTQESRASTRTSTPFAMSTSTALRSAGNDRAGVSRPRKSGPEMAWPRRVSTVAWVVATRCCSCKLVERDALGRHGRVGDPVVVGGDQLVDIDEIVFLRGEASSARHALQSAARVPDAHLRRETVVAETGWGAGTRLAG